MSQVFFYSIGLNTNYSRQTKDTVNYCVFINKLLELMGDERIQVIFN